MKTFVSNLFTWAMTNQNCPQGRIGHNTMLSFLYTMEDLCSLYDNFGKAKYW